MFKDSSLLITGGTGSFGKAVLDRFLRTDIEEIRIFSRDEKKQDDLRKAYLSSKLKFYIGDVRDRQSLNNAFSGVDYIFHAAALKQVPSCEFYPMEAVKTNILGTENVLDIALENNVKKVVCLSTDKAVYPINAMGISKALMEKVMVAKSRNLENKNTIICGTRYGNVMGSRGSVIPVFLEKILNNKKLPITDPQMTRFMMTLDQAVELVMFAFQNGKNGDIFVQKSPAATVECLCAALLDIYKVDSDNFEIIGTRHGEKLYETLLSREEMAVSVDMGDYYKIPPDNRDLNYSKFYDTGNLNIAEAEEYNSHNTQRLNIEDMTNLLLGLKNISESIPN
tara:strand:- start:169 stop:1182 length:1014 start_codon:yes stop_codon:yes gene_type:complete